MTEMKFIDFRSDTVTIPTQEMLDAIYYAEAGDDVYGDDPTVRKLEEKSAEILGKEDSVFVPSGTFGNQLALMTHTERGDEVLIPHDNHIVVHEVGASAVIAGVQLRLMHDGKNGSIDIEELKKLYRTEDIHHPKTGLVCMENAHSSGVTVPLENICSVHEYANILKVPMHLDGARIFNAAISAGVKPREISKYFDSVMFCFSKGLCAPIGSIVAGSSQFIKKARKNRKLMGGGMRQVGYIAAPCIVALENMIERLRQDHENAKYLASGLKDIPGFEVMEDRLDINMVFLKPSNYNDTTRAFDSNGFVEYLLNNGIRVNPLYEGEFRFVTHYYISREKIDFTVERIKNFIAAKK